MMGGGGARTLSLGVQLQPQWRPTGDGYGQQHLVPGPVVQRQVPVPHLGAPQPGALVKVQHLMHATAKLILKRNFTTLRLFCC